jgi:hypothetical protein
MVDTTPAKASNRAVSDLITETGAPGDDYLINAQASRVPRNRGYRMIESVLIENFRSFRRVELKGFKRINILVGDNAAGKTTLLEALFAVSANSAEIGSRLRVWRGLEQAGGTPAEVYESLFLSLFHNFDRQIVGSVKTTGSDEDARQLKFYYDTGSQISLPLNTIAGVRTLQSTYSPVVFEYTNSSGKTEKSVAQIQAQGIVIGPTSPRTVDSTFLSARQPFSGFENARWFSDLSKKNKEGRFLKALQQQFPQIESLSVEVELGAPAVFVKTKWLGRKIPIGLASDGLTKLLTVLLHVAHAERTATFIDELENGLHFSRHEKIWSQLLESATEFQSQIFASTHSFEFIKAAAPVIKKHPDQFAIVRAYQDEGVGKATILQGDAALSLIEAGLEIRV